MWALYSAFPDLMQSLREPDRRTQPRFLSSWNSVDSFKRQRFVRFTERAEAAWVVIKWCWKKRKTIPRVQFSYSLLTLRGGTMAALLQVRENWECDHRLSPRPQLLFVNFIRSFSFPSASSHRRTFKVFCFPIKWLFWFNIWSWHFSWGKGCWKTRFVFN